MNMFPEKLSVSLNKSDGVYSAQNRTMSLSNCMVAKAIKRALKKAGYEGLVPIVGYRSVSLVTMDRRNRRSYNDLPVRVSDEIHNWVKATKDYNPKRLRFTIRLAKVSPL
jgi:hypothetical protein